MIRSRNFQLGNLEVLGNLALFPWLAWILVLESS